MPEANHSPIPVTIVGGFLGSGKTSLSNHILSNASGKRLAVLVNDFGAINVDAKLIVSIEGETISLANGCVCCTIRDDLLDEVLKLLQRVPLPEHIVIETSGVSKPVSVAETFFNPATQSRVDVHNMIAVLDADLVVDEDAGYGDLAFEQISVSDIIVINKTDLVAAQQLGTLKKKVEALVPRASIWETEFGVVPLHVIFHDQLSEAMAGVQPDHAADIRRHPHNHHDEMFGTWTYQSDERFSFNALQRAVENLPKEIYRAKGTVRLDLDSGDYGIFHLTGRRSWLRLQDIEDEEPKTELVFIGKPDSANHETLREVFERALYDARSKREEPHMVRDLRSFNVIFA